MTFTYLASPYTHADPAVREERFRAAAKKASELMRRGLVVFSPISHSHPIDTFYDAPESGLFWKAQDEPFLNACSSLMVLMLDGWEGSKGLAHEVEVATQRGIPIAYEHP